MECLARWFCFLIAIEAAKIIALIASIGFIIYLAFVTLTTKTLGIFACYSLLGVEALLLCVFLVVAIRKIKNLLPLI